MTERATYEPQYQRALDLEATHGLLRLGLMTNQHWHDDPKRVGFVMARYKFVAKMMEGFDRVLEMGCGDGFYDRIVAQAVGHLTACDIDPLLIEDALARPTQGWDIEYCIHDALSGPTDDRFDGVYSLDVLEHIPPEDEETFLSNLAACLHPHGVAVVGSPSLESQAHASEISRRGHVNCKTGSDLKRSLERHFRNVFLFSMNDEVVHTGFTPMAHYLLALCCGPLNARG